MDNSCKEVPHRLSPPTACTTHRSPSKSPLLFLEAIEAIRPNQSGSLSLQLAEASLSKIFPGLTYRYVPLPSGSKEVDALVAVSRKRLHARDCAIEIFSASPRFSLRTPSAFLSGF